MAKTPEGRIKDAVVKLLKAHGVYYFFPATHGYGRSGVPDIVCCVKGRFLAIECKAPGKKPTALQEREMGRIGEAGGVALVIDSEDVSGLDGMLKSYFQ
jgi:Holliday junction resolvase